MISIIQLSSYKSRKVDLSLELELMYWLGLA